MLTNKYCQPSPIIPFFQDFIIYSYGGIYEEAKQNESAESGPEEKKREKFSEKIEG